MLLSQADRAKRRWLLLRGGRRGGALAVGLLGGEGLRWMESGLA
jgi:hypothetical protein